MVENTTENIFCCKCCKKINLTYIECKCLMKLCSKHIHDHNCEYDYKAHWREEIRRKNPVVKKAKIEKI